MHFGARKRRWADLGDDGTPVAHALLDFVGHLVPLRLPPVADLLYALLRSDLLLPLIHI